MSGKNGPKWLFRSRFSILGQAPSALRDMTALMQGPRPVFVHLVGYKEGRTFWLTSVEMSLGDEDDRKLVSELELNGRTLSQNAP